MSFFKHSFIFLSCAVLNFGIYAGEGLADEKRASGELLARVIDSFAGRSTDFQPEEFFGPVRKIQLPDGRIVLGLHEDNQGRMNYREFRARLAKLLKVTVSNMVEIVGDSGPFSGPGTEFVRALLETHLSKAGIVEYGFTGKTLEDQRSEINAAVSRYASMTDGQKFIGNIVGQTVTALNKWPQVIGSPHVKTLVAVYNDEGSKPAVFNPQGIQVAGGTIFGDDIRTSDLVLGQGDMLLCVEGGLQSCRQTMNALSCGAQAICVTGVRADDRKNFFSAAHFFKLIADAYQADTSLTDSHVSEIYDEYTKGCIGLWDAHKEDCETKKKLTQGLVQEFIRLGIKHRINQQCAFIRFDSGARL